RYRVVGSPTDVLHRHRLFRQAFHTKTVDIPFEVTLVHFELIGGDHLRLGLDLARRHGDRGPRHRRRARTVSAEPVGRGIGVAFLDHDVVGGNSDLGGDDLCPGRLVTLAGTFG